MQLEDVLGQVDSEDVDLHVYLPPDSCSQSQRRTGGAVHPIKWKAKFGGLEVSDARKLKSLEGENARLKRLLADAMLDNAVLKDLLGKS